MTLAAARKRPPLHSLERLLLGVLSMLLVASPWMFGSSRWWGQIACLAVAAAAFIVSLWPRHYTADVSGAGNFTLYPWRRLVRFPLFWIGLVFMGYMGLQASNPSWVRVEGPRSWWMTRIDDIPWLPTSTDTPFLFYNLWRFFAFYCAAWLTVCAIWIGVTRRRSLQILLWVIVSNALLISLVGIVHRYTTNGKVLWLLEIPGAIGFGSFIYHNHGAAYVSLMSMAALGLAAWSRSESQRRMARSSPAMVWAVAALIMFVAVAYSTSRAGAGLLIGFLGMGFLVYFFRRPESAGQSTTPRAVGFSLAMVVVACLAFIVAKSDLSGLTSKFESLYQNGSKEASYGLRIKVRERALEMLEDNWVRGTGTGSFRFLFPTYAKRTPDLYHGGTAYWEHAHIDWLQFPIEQGIAGCTIIAAALGWCLYRWWKTGGWRHPLPLILFLACVQTMVHALIDFPFQNAAIFIAWWTLLVIALRWLEFEEA